MKRKAQELLGIIAFAIINILIAYAITTPLGVKDVILYESMTAMKWTLTYEIIIWFCLGLLEACIYEYKIKKSEV